MTEIRTRRVRQAGSSVTGSDDGPYAQKTGTFSN